MYNLKTKCMYLPSDLSFLQLLALYMYIYYISCIYLQKRNQPPAAMDSPPVSPRRSDDSTKVHLSLTDKINQKKMIQESKQDSNIYSYGLQELFLLHQALNPEFVCNQQLLKNGVTIILQI